MEIVLANPRGFCAGVDRAIAIVNRALECFNPPIYVRHEVVHNKFVVDDLRQRGAIFVDELDEVPDGNIVIFSAHGVSKAVQQEAERRGFVEQAEIFAAHRVLADDPEMFAYASGLIAAGKSAAFAWRASVEAQCATLSATGNPLLVGRVADLRGELDRAHADVDQVRAELSRAHADVDQARAEIKRTATDAEGLRNELAAAKAKVDAAEQAHQEQRKEAAKEAQRCAEKVLAAQKSHDAIAKEAAAARESAARLSGQLEAVQAQNKALMETLRGKVAGNG